MNVMDRGQAPSERDVRTGVVTELTIYELDYQTSPGLTGFAAWTYTQSSRPDGEALA